MIRISYNGYLTAVDVNIDYAISQVERALKKFSRIMPVDKADDRRLKALYRTLARTRNELVAARKAWMKRLEKQQSARRGG